MKPHISDTTLVCVDCKNYGSAITALKKSMEQCSFDRVLFLTDKEFNQDGIDVVLIDKITNVRQYSEFMIKSLYKYIQTPYMIVCQADGYILNGDLWQESWKEYDYIGASWLERDGHSVGNGGFSFRSKAIMQTIAQYAQFYHPEDNIICRIYRPLLEMYDFKFAPEKVADLFSYELKQPNQKTFGFHGRFWPEYKETVVIKRTGAMGDVIGVEPVLRYFFDKGYNVALNCYPDFYRLFQKHHYPVTFVDAIAPHISYTEIDLDMSYESEPKKLHLSSYFEFSGVTDYKLSKPALNFKITPENRIFDKYVVIHIDKREQESRNVRVIDRDWKFLIDRLIKSGHTVVQVGKNDSKDLTSFGAIRFNCASLEMLHYLIAGANGFIGCDSGPSHIAVASNVPAMIFFGSVNPEYIHPDMSRIIPVVRKKVCDKPFCWHETVGTTGTPCYIDNDNPPCVKFELHEIENSFIPFLMLIQS